MQSFDQVKRSAVEQLLREFGASADPSYKDFSAKLKVTSKPDTIIGIRMPMIRKTACKLAKLLTANDAIGLLATKAEEWYEYKLLLAITLKETCSIADADRVIALLYSLCDGWATSDLYQEVLGELALRGAKDKVLNASKKHINNPNQFARRLTIVTYFPLLKAGITNVDDALAHIALLANDTTYYVEMACAWLLAEIKITHPHIDLSISNPTLHKRYQQKLRESLRHKP